MVCKLYNIDKFNWKTIKLVTDVALRGDLMIFDYNVYVYDGHSWFVLRQGDGCLEMDYNIGPDFPPEYWMTIDEINVSNFTLGKPKRIKYSIYHTWIKYDNFNYITEYIPEHILSMECVKEVLDGYKPITFTSTLNGVVTKIIRNPNWAFNSNDEVWDVRVLGSGYVLCDHMIMRY